MLKIKIFDLDHTVIDSSHRQITKLDGSLDLKAWRENCTAEKIAQDKLLPLAEKMREFHRLGDTVIVCTARVMTTNDRQYLLDNGLFYTALLCRDGENDNREDYILKREKLTEYFASQNISLANWTRRAVFYDDNESVLRMANELGIKTHNAIILNRQLARLSK